MQDDPYSLTELCRVAGVTPRTVRYYVAQGLLRSPDAAGPATRYGEGHLARLRLIRLLQREHQPLAEIRSRLEQLNDDAVAGLLTASAVQEAPVPSEPSDTLEFIRGLMARSSSRTYPRLGTASPLRVAEAAWTPPAPTERPRMAAAMSFRDAVSPPSPSPSTPTAPDRSTWERVAITSDVEIHLRRPLDRLAIRRVDQLLKYARDLFEREA